MNVVIRSAELHDSEFIAELSNQLGYTSKKYSIEKRLTEILKLKDHCVFVAIQNKIIIGWIHAFYALRIESDAFVEIGGLVVHEDYRKMSVGKQLVQKIVIWSLAKNCDKLRVRCNTIREESHMFYQKIGFEVSKKQYVFDMILVKDSLEIK